MTRTGKIARLPLSLREELNRRLCDGEQGKDLVDWLNNQPAVQEVLRKDFGGRLVNEQSLSEWKQGGYEDWLRHQETRSWVQELASQSADIGDDIDEGAGDLSVADLLSARAAIALGHWLHSSATKAPEDPKHARALLDIVRELARLRRDDHSQKCLAIQRERWEKDLKFKLLTLISKAPQQSPGSRNLVRQTLVEMRGDAIQKRYADRKKRQSLSAEEEAHYKKVLAKIASWQNDPREAAANEHVLVAAGSSDPEPFYDQS